MTRNVHIAILSVRQSVRHVPVLDENCKLNILGIKFHTKYLLTKSCLREHSRFADIFGLDLTSRVVAY